MERQDGNVTTVGSAGPLSQSFYGTSDQGGNVLEWNEALISGIWRNVRGGAFVSHVTALRSTDRLNFLPPEVEDGTYGFRVATTVPEPSTLTLAALGFLSLLIATRRTR